MQVLRAFDDIPERTWRWGCFLGGALILALLFAHHALAASRVIDGIRYFWLDDDVMVAMRYGRNLAEGHGLVWNVGERVEGYSSFLWTLMMAAVHAAGASDAKAALILQGLNLLLCLALLGLTIELVRTLIPAARAATLVASLIVVTCTDVVFWAASGFETTLLAVLNLVFLVRHLRRGEDVVAYVALALIPLTRSDGLYIWAGNATLAMLLSRRRLHTVGLLLLTLIPTAAHFGFRRFYYGEWLPNTYYVKVYGLQDKLRRGLSYSHKFLVHYAVLLCLGFGASLTILRRDRRSAALLPTIGLTIGYSLLVGGDMFSGFRFFSHVMPVLIAFAVAGAAVLAASDEGRFVLYTLLLLVSVPLVRPIETIARVSANGLPDSQVPVALLLKKNALPTSSVAVMPAGIVPYFSRLRTLDVLGKNDKYIARLPYQAGATIGHGKLDPDYTLLQKPDFVVSCRSHGVVASPPRTTTPNAAYLSSFLQSTRFRNEYFPHPVDDPFLMSHSAVYTHASSPERERRARWSPLALGPVGGR